MLRKINYISQSLNNNLVKLTIKEVPKLSKKEQLFKVEEGSKQKQLARRKMTH